MTGVEIRCYTTEAPLVTGVTLNSTIQRANLLLHSNVKRQRTVSLPVPFR